MYQLQLLQIDTPNAWLQKAIGNQETLLVDHAHCERKAAENAMTLIQRYMAYPDLLVKLSRLAREELGHFEKVLKHIKKAGYQFIQIEPSRYARRLKRQIRKNEPDRLIDELIVGAYIEARSCERFKLIAPHLNDHLKKFYTGLLASEYRHYQDYLNLAKTLSQTDITQRIDEIGKVEAALIIEPDPMFRFHSGQPID